MPVGHPMRVDDANPRHHLWCHNGTRWVHSTIHFDCVVTAKRLPRPEAGFAMTFRDQVFTGGRRFVEAPGRRHDTEDSP